MGIVVVSRFPFFPGTTLVSPEYRKRHVFFARILHSMRREDRSHGLRRDATTTEKASRGYSMHTF